ncbi:MAG: class I tRNA ligase family protein [Acutalibacteraceae bacterium]
MEGADQYRGWFQSSFNSGGMARYCSYKAVVTHGWAVDGEGRKMSKSLSNGVAPNKLSTIRCRHFTFVGCIF